jgi:hypothetical protein
MREATATPLKSSCSSAPTLKYILEKLGPQPVYFPVTINPLAFQGQAAGTSRYRTHEDETTNILEISA